MPAFLRFFDRAFGRYTLTSALATASDFALASSLHALGVSAGVATFLGCALGGSVAFAVGRGWGLVELRTEETSLEEIYLRVVSSEGVAV